MGNNIMIYAVDSDQTAVLITILRYFVGVMKAPGNEDLMTSFMGSGSSENDMFATYSGGITEQLASMTTDETVEWLYKLFFRERPIVEEKNEEEYLPTIIYKEHKLAEGTSVYFFFLFLALAEVIYIKERIRINRYIHKKARAFKKTKKQTTQEV
jgi:hypothetical protein